MDHATEEARMFPWYDSLWLEGYERARQEVLAREPSALPAFEQAFAPLRTSPSFRVRRLPQALSPADFATALRVLRSLKHESLELHELESHGRFVVHDHPELTEMQGRLTAMVSAEVGEEVEPSYNFLSMYHERGSCALHLDDPLSKWTLDICLDTSVDWPIRISEVCDWPTAEDMSAPNWAERLTGGLEFTEHVMRPGEGIIFSGSAQWHLREPIERFAKNAHCDLLFFHFRPKGSAKLTDVSRWARGERGRA